ncbi:MAG: hypothetical protein AAGT88_01690 [Dethiobacter sp.]
MEAKKEDWERGGNVGKKLFVVEARRVLPLLFLLVLLISLSVYDSFRVSPTVKPEDVAAKGQVNFTTADKGEMKENPSFRIAPCQASWAAVVDEWSIVLPQYPFQPQHEVALFVLHAEVESLKSRALAAGSLGVEVRVNPKRDYFHVVTVPASEVTLQGGEVTWTFVDSRANVLERFTVRGAKQTTAEEAPQK